MAELRKRKTNEKRMNQEIFENVSLLLRCHPGTTQLKSILNANMFSKPNKSAFQEVSFYLLTVADRQLAKEKLKSWPLILPSQEIQFRSELIESVNVLNSKHKRADLPVFQLSHLVCPGGYKIGVLIFKLSQLAIREHLTRANIAVPLPPKIGGNPELGASNLTAVFSELAAAIDADTKKKLDRLITTHIRLKEQAGQVSCLIRKTQEEISRCKKELKEAEERHVDLLKIFDMEVADLKQRVAKTLEINQLFVSSKSLLDQLADLVLQHDPSDTVSTRDGQLDLIQYLQGTSDNFEYFPLLQVRIFRNNHVAGEAYPKYSHSASKLRKPHHGRNRGSNSKASANPARSQKRRNSNK